MQIDFLFSRVTLSTCSRKIDSCTVGFVLIYTEWGHPHTLEHTYIYISHASTCTQTTEFRFRSYHEGFQRDLVKFFLYVDSGLKHLKISWNQIQHWCHFMWLSVSHFCQPGRVWSALATQCENYALYLPSIPISL